MSSFSCFSLHDGETYAGPSELPGLLLSEMAVNSSSCPSVVENAPQNEAGQVGAFDSVPVFHRSSHPPFFLPSKHTLAYPPTHAATQVLHDTWSVIVTLRPETFAILVAPFEGMQLPPYRGDSCVDSRDLCYDPRGWWRHAPALITNPPTGPGRLHRLARGISATGLPWGAGSLNEPLMEGKIDERPCSGGGHGTAGEGSTRDCTSEGGNEDGRSSVCSGSSLCVERHYIGLEACAFCAPQRPQQKYVCIEE